MGKLLTSLTALLGVFSAAEVSAQEAMREMLNSRPAPMAPPSENQTYTFKVKDLQVLLTPTFGIDYNDNVNISENGSQSDVILRPMLNMQGMYPLTDRNMLSFSVGVGYDHYIDNTDLSGLSLTSGSGVNFDVGIGDFLINFHDRFSYTQDAARQTAIAGSADYGSANNTIGALTTWNLGDVTLSLGYDHQNVMSTSQTAENFQSQDHSSELLVARSGFRIDPELTAGIEGTAAFTTYDQKVLNDNNSYSAGVYAEWQTAALSIQPRVGYTMFDFKHTSSTIETASSDSWYADLTASYAITRVLSASVSGGHQVRLGIQSDAIETWYLRPGMSWAIIDGGSLHLGLSYEKGKQGVGNEQGNLKETYDYYGANIGFAYQVTKRLTASLNYRLITRSSDDENRGYTQNMVGLQLTYPLR